MCGGASPTRKITFNTDRSADQAILFTASSSAWLTDSGSSPPPSALKALRFLNTASRSSVRSNRCVTYASPRSRYPISANFTSGVGFCFTIWFAIAQIFAFAPSISPDIDPVVSSTKHTCTCGFGSTLPVALSSAAKATQGQTKNATTKAIRHMTDSLRKEVSPHDDQHIPQHQVHFIPQRQP